MKHLSLILSLVFLSTSLSWAQPNLGDILRGGGAIFGGQGSRRGGSDLEKVLQIGGLIYQVHQRSKNSDMSRSRDRTPIFQPRNVPVPMPPTQPSPPQHNGQGKPDGYDYIAVNGRAMRLAPASLPLSINPGRTEQTQTVQKAVDLWNSAGMGTLFTLTHGPADLTVDWSGRSLAPGSRAETRMKTSARKVIPVGIVVKPDGRSQYQLARVMTHELGHVLGLDHSEHRGDIMYRSEGNGDLILSQRDTRMVRWLYTQPDYVPVIGATQDYSNSSALFQPAFFRDI